MHNRLGTTFGILFLLTVLIFSFQNCSSPTNFGTQINQSLNVGNGWAYEGIIYNSTSKCSDGAPRGQISLMSDGRALLVKDNCVGLDTPILLAASDIQFSAANPTELIYKGEVFTTVPTVVARYNAASICTGVNPYDSLALLSDGRGIMYHDNCVDLTMPRYIPASEIRQMSADSSHFRLGAEALHILSTIPFNTVTSGRITVEPTLAFPTLMIGQSQQMTVTIVADQDGAVNTLFSVSNAMNQVVAEVNIAEYMKAGVPKTFTRTFGSVFQAGNYTAFFGFYTQNWNSSSLDQRWPAFASFQVQ